MHTRLRQSGTHPLGFRVGEWLVEPSLDRVSRGDETVHLRHRLMDLLVHFALHPGEVLRQDDIIAAVWEREFLAESVLTRSITELRHALGDDPAAPRYIETVTKRGYRLIAPVTTMAGASGSAPARAHARFVVSHAGERLMLPEGETIIGRALEAALRVDAASVSRFHARIVVDGGRAWIEDLGSKNGTLVDEASVHGRVELNDGARIRVGPALMVVRILGADGTTETDPRQRASTGASGVVQS